MSGWSLPRASQPTWSEAYPNLVLECGIAPVQDERVVLAEGLPVGCDAVVEAGELLVQHSGRDGPRARVGRRVDGAVRVAWRRLPGGEAWGRDRDDDR